METFNQSRGKSSIKGCKEYGFYAEDLLHVIMLFHNYERYIEVFKECNMLPKVKGVVGLAVCIIICCTLAYGHLHVTTLMCLGAL